MYSEILSKPDLEFILNHFTALDFPRTISTKTTEGRQKLVNDKEEALARFKQANYLDCRINAYTELDEAPSFIFIDLDTDCRAQLGEVLTKIVKTISGNPTVLFTGSGYHVYQPIRSLCLEKFADFENYEEPSKQFLKFAEKYLSNNLSDVNHSPSFKSCMVRVPSSINTKNGKRVKIVQKWDGKRPDIALLIGSFYAWLATKKIAERRKWNKNYSRISLRQANNKIQWIELLLSTDLDDYRKTIVNLVLAPYFCNIRQLQFDAAFTIIKSWLELCAAQRKLDFNTQYLINQALVNARKTNYKPMRLNTLKERNHALFERLCLK